MGEATQKIFAAELLKSAVEKEEIIFIVLKIKDRRHNRKIT